MRQPKQHTSCCPFSPWRSLLDWQQCGLQTSQQERSNKEQKGIVSRQSGVKKAIKGATVKWSITHELTHFESQLWMELVGLRKLAKGERSSVWSGVTASLDSTRSNHKSYVFPMFLPSSPHRKPQSAYSDRTSKASPPVCWNRMSEWQIDMDMYFDTNCLACEFSMLCIQRYKSAYPPNNIIKGNPLHVPSLTTRVPLFWWSDSGGICSFTKPQTPAKIQSNVSVW